MNRTGATHPLPPPNRKSFEMLRGEHQDFLKGRYEAKLEFPVNGGWGGGGGEVGLNQKLHQWEGYSYFLQQHIQRSYLHKVLRKKAREGADDCLIGSKNCTVLFPPKTFAGVPTL